MIRFEDATNVRDGCTRSILAFRNRQRIYDVQFRQLKKYLAVVSAKISELVVRVKVKHSDDVSIHRCEHAPSVAELDLPALLDGNLMARPHVIHQQVHHTDFVRKADYEMKP